MQLEMELMSGESSALNGKSFLIMREPSQAKQLVDGIHRFGGQTHLVPLLGFKRHDIGEREISILKNLINYDWLIFTSQNGVKFFMEYLEEYDFNPPVKSKIATVGTKTLEALESYGLKADFVPGTFTGDDLGEELKGLIGLNEQVCIIKGNLAKDKAGIVLKQSGIHVDEMVVYDTFLPDENKLRLINCLKNFQIDGLIFTSPSTVQHFVTILQEDGSMDLITGKAIAAIGTVTEKALLDSGFTADIRPRVFTGEALLSEIVKFYQ